MHSQANHGRERRSRLGAAHRTSSHPIHSTILLAAIAAALATTISLVMVASGNTALAATSLVNGNFETGDLTGWTVQPASGGDASVVTSYEYCSAATSLECGVIVTMPPQEGSYFALLTPGAESVDTRISQPFEASNGDKVSGWAFFHAADYLPYDDKAQVVITSDSGTTVATPFEESVSSVGQDQNSGWKYWEYTFTGLTGAGKFQIEARVHNTGDSASPSRMGLDDVKTSTGNPDTTAPDTTITSGPSGLTNDNTPTFSFSGSDNVSPTANLLYSYKVDDEQWSAYSSETSVTLGGASGLSDGFHTFYVKAKDEAGNEDQSPAQQSFTVDTKAPKVDSVVPTEDATKVAPGTDVHATFFEAMRADSINTNTFQLFRAGTTTPIAAVVSYNAEWKTATLNPDANLRRGTKYKAVVSTATMDLAGNQLDQDATLSGNQPKEWFFTIRK